MPVYDKSYHTHIPEALEDGGRLAPMAAEMVAWQFWWRFVDSMAWVLLTLVHCVLRVIYACNISFVHLLMFPFDGFGGMCGENSFNVFMLLFMVL
jgi:hypothetical protein